MTSNFKYILISILSLLLSNCSPHVANKVQDKNLTFNQNKEEKKKPAKFQVEDAQEEKADKILSSMIAIDPDYKIGNLPNGMKYYIKKNSKPEKRIEMRLAVKVGSVDEDEDQKGVAHFTEHMMFNGTEHFDKNKLIDYLESTGMKFGADLNAYTTFDNTVYKLQVRSDKPGQVDTGLIVLKDWANGANFADDEIDKERGVVISEWRSRLSAQQRMAQQYYPIIYKDSKYADRLPIGDPEIIKNANYQTIKRFYKDWYRPDLMAIVVIGDLDPLSIEKKVKDIFTTMESKVNNRIKSVNNIPLGNSKSIKIVSDKESSGTTVRILNKMSHHDPKTNKDMLVTFRQVLADMMFQSRLDELTNLPDPPYTRAFAGYSQDIGDIDMYSMFAMTDQNKPLEAIRTLLTECKRVQQYGFQKTELDRQYSELLKSMEIIMKEKDKTESAIHCNDAIYNFLNNEPLLSAEQSYNFVLNNKDFLDLTTINLLAKNSFNPEKAVYVITGIQKEGYSLPGESDVEKVIQSVSQSIVEEYKDNVSDKPLIAKQLSTTRILDSKLFDKFDIKKISVPNGVEIYYKKTDYKNDEVLLSAYAPGGTSIFEDEDIYNANFASQIIGEMGIGEFDKTQLEKKLAGKNAYANFNIGPLYESINGSCSSDDLETMFQLIYLKFTSPSKNQDAFSSFINKTKSMYANMLKSPDNYFRLQLSKIQFDNNPRANSLIEPEKLDKINLDRVYEIYKSSFADAGQFKFFIVGNFDENKLIEYCSKYLGNLFSTHQNQNWIDRKIDMVNKKTENTIAFGQAPKTYVDLTYHGDCVSSIENIYIFSSMIDVLKIKLRESLREDLGGVYGVSVSGRMKYEPNNNYVTNISFNADPSNTDKLIEAAKAVLTKIKTEGVDEETLNKVKETQKQDKIKNLKENRYWLSGIENRVHYKIDFEDLSLEALQAKIDKLNSQLIQESVKKYFDEDTLIKTIMTPQNQSELK